MNSVLDQLFELVGLRPRRGRVVLLWRILHQWGYTRHLRFTNRIDRDNDVGIAYVDPRPEIRVNLDALAHDPGQTLLTAIHEQGHLQTTLRHDRAFYKWMLDALAKVGMDVSNAPTWRNRSTLDRLEDRAAVELSEMVHRLEAGGAMSPKMRFRRGHGRYKTAPPTVALA